jgi:uncharacterized cupin superfamily protein
VDDARALAHAIAGFHQRELVVVHEPGSALQHYHDVKLGVVPVPSGACRGWREVGSHQLGQDPTVRRRRDAETAVHEEVTQPPVFQAVSPSLTCENLVRVEFEPLVPAVFTVCEEAIMARGSKVFRPADVSESNASSYPEPFREGQRKRYTRRLGDHAGLKNYGVNLVRVLPGGQSSARHTHSKQDEFVYVIEGEFVLVTDAGRETVGPGTCIGFPAGTGDGHHFLNLTQKDAVFLVIGDRTAGDEVTYPDIDLELKAGPDGVRGFHRKDGTPYPRAAQD